MPMMFRHCGRRVVGSALLLLTISPDALAYIDPGSGMLVWQGVIALVGAVIVFVRQPWATLMAWIRRVFRR